MSAGAQTASPPSPPVSVYGAVPGDPTSVSASSAAEQPQPAAVETAQPKRGEFVFAPMPMVNPTLENGLALMVGYIYRVDVADKTTPPSATALGGFKTSNGSWMASLVQSLHLDHDRYRVVGLAAYTNLNYKFYGIGQSAGNAGVSIELNQVGTVGMIEGLVRVFPNGYAGARYQILDMSVATHDVTIPDGPTIPGADADLRTAALGPRFDYDSRDNPFYARKGWQGRMIASFYGKDVGGTRTYQAYDGFVNRYYAAGPKNVVAWHAGVCGVDGPVPFYDLCLLGKNQDIRGYVAGQYRDRAMVAAQAEWRTELWWRFGATAFVGGGEVKDSFGALTWKDVLPGYGVGARFTLARRNHVNLRVDYGWGKDSSALYIGVMEAF